MHDDAEAALAERIMGEMMETARVVAAIVHEAAQTANAQAAVMPRPDAMVAATRRAVNVLDAMIAHDAGRRFLLGVLVILAIPRNNVLSTPPSQG